MAREFSRTERVSQQLHKEIASILQNEYKHRVGHLPMITVSGVEVSRDLAHAKVFVTCLIETDEEVKKQVTQLNDYKGFVRSLLAKRVRMRAVPALHFHSDVSITEGMRISNLVTQTIAEDEKRRESSSKQDDE